VSTVSLTESELGALVREAFERALGLPVGLDDDFFELGGDSLTAMVVVSEVQLSLVLEIDPTAVLAHPTPRALGEAIGRGDVVADAGLVEEPFVLDVNLDPRSATEPAHEPPPERVRAWPVQEGQIMLAPFDASRGFLSWAVQFNGKLDVEALTLAIDDVVARHDVLRARFEQDGGKWYLRPTPFVPGVLRIEDLTDRPKSEAIDAAVDALRATYASLSHTDDPRFRAVLHRIDRKTNVLGIFVAEALVDGESGNLLAAEIARAYAARADLPLQVELPEASGASYLEHVAAHPVKASMVRRARQHWTEQVREVPTGLDWPAAPAGDEGGIDEGDERDADQVATAGFELPETRWEELADAGSRLRSTRFVVVLACLQAALSRVAGAERILVTSVVTDRSNPATVGMIGCFNSIVRIDGQVHPGDALADVVARSTGAVRDAVGHCGVPAPLAIAQATGDPDAAPPTTAVHLYLFERRESPMLPGVRRRRFRLNSASREGLRVNCTRAASGAQSFFLSSATAPPEVLTRVATDFEAALHTAIERPQAPVDQIEAP
jgi:acyl carrier protein